MGVSREIVDPLTLEPVADGKEGELVFTSLTKIQGRHSLKTGFDVREARESSASYGNSAGSYTFREDYVRGPLDTSTVAPLGQDLASFMLGYPTGGSFAINTFRTQQAKYFATFIQDDFRLRSNLTFNMGLRYEGDLGTTERFNRSVNGFDGTVASPIAPATAVVTVRCAITEKSTTPRRQHSSSYRSSRPNTLGSPSATRLARQAMASTV